MANIDEIRQRRMEELQRQAQEQNQQIAQQQEFEAQKKQILMRILTPEARSRLANIRLTKPEFVQQIELQLIQLAQTGQIQSKITDAQLKDLLKRIIAPKKEFNIRRK